MSIRGALAVAVLVSGMVAVRAHGVTVYAVAEVGDETNLLTFDSATPGTLDANVQISGTAPNRLTAIDVRPATGVLYGLAVDGGITMGFLYRIDPQTAQATAVGTGFPLPQAAGLMSAGTDFGFDFNPVVDQIRITSNTGDNFRVDPDTGMVVGADTQLSREQIGGIAYNNNFPGATVTTLFAVDEFNNELVRIGGINGVPSPNGGVVSSVGGIGFDDGGSDGFDIATGAALAVLTAAGVDTLYSINLASGLATSLGAVGAGDLNILAMAIVLDVPPAGPAPAPALSIAGLAAALLALAAIGAGRLLRRRRS